MGASLRKGLGYHRANSFRIRQNVIIPEAQHLEPNALQIAGSVFVLFAIVMLTSVHFDDDAHLKTGKIRNVGTQGMLAAETMPIQSASLQNLPELPLGKSHVSTQLACPIAFGGITHSHSLRDPIPQV